MNPPFRDRVRLHATTLLIGALTIAAAPATAAVIAPAEDHRPGVSRRRAERMVARTTVLTPDRRAEAAREHARLVAALPPQTPRVPEPDVTAAAADEPEPAAEPESGETATTASAPTDGVWQRLAACESDGRWHYDGPSGFDGGLQFHPGTWSAYAPADYPAYAHQATPAQQIAVAREVRAAQGWGAWPRCARELGLH